MSQWSSGTGLGGLLRSILQNPRVQQAGFSMFQGLGGLILQAINSGDMTKLRGIGQNLQSNPQAFVGAMLANTEVENHVDDSAKRAAEAVTNTSGTAG